MAAGSGSRYGKLKQFDDLGPNKEFLLEFSIYDAIENGFDHIVLITKLENKDFLYDYLRPRIPNEIKIDVIVQEISNLPNSLTADPRRLKPWGTAHAVWCAKDVINTDFAIINADDFYGKGAFNKILETLKYIDSKNIKASIVTYLIENTLSSYGGVSRGVCKTEGNKLIDIKETHELKKYGNKVKGIYENKEIKFPNGTQVAMNLIGFQKSIFNKLNKYFTKFLEKNISEEKKEFLIPDIVGDLISENVYVDITDENWFGVTYKKDCEIVKNKIKDLVTKKVYPSPLWK